MKTYNYICNACGEEQPISETYARKLRSNNPDKICRTCKARQGRDDYKKLWKVTEEGRTCKICKTWKEWNFFSAARTKRGKEERIHCLDCLKKTAKTRWYENKQVYQKRARKSYLKSKYGLAEEDVTLMLEGQKGKCAICKQTLTSPCIDHEHKSGKIRQLLCRACNILLGKAKEDVKILESAIEYLRRHSET